MPLRPLVAAVFLVALAACAQPSTAGPGGATSAPPATESTGAAEQLPSRLVGLWSVESADMGEGVLLAIGPNHLQLYEECGDFYGQWDASVDGTFIGYIGSYSGSCSPPSSTPSWIATATSFRFDGEVAALLDATGTPTARFHPATADALPPDGSPLADGVPVATEADRQRLDARPALPAGLAAATSETLTGRWVPDRPIESEAFLAFEPNGSWRGSDGCNGIGGAWSDAAGGALLGVAGPQTSMGCSGQEFGGWLTSATTAGFDGAALVLLDDQGNEIGRLLAG